MTKPTIELVEHKAMCKALEVLYNNSDDFGHYVASVVGLAGNFIATGFLAGAQLYDTVVPDDLTVNHIVSEHLLAIVRDVVEANGGAK